MWNSIRSHWSDCSHRADVKWQPIPSIYSALLLEPLHYTGNRMPFWIQTSVCHNQTDPKIPLLPPHGQLASLSLATVCPVDCVQIGGEGGCMEPPRYPECLWVESFGLGSLLYTGWRERFWQSVCVCVTGDVRKELGMELVLAWTRTVCRGLNTQSFIKSLPAAGVISCSFLGGRERRRRG